MNTPQRLTTIAGCSLVAAVCACDVSTVNIEEATPDIQQVAAENKLDPAGMSLDELNEVLNQSATEAELVADLLKSGLNYSLRLKEFRGHVETGFAAAQAIEQHADSSQDQKMTAGSQGLQLLYVGAKTDRATFAEKLQNEVAIRLETNEASDVAALGEALVLELTVLSGEGEHAAKMEALNHFAGRRPDSPTGPALFLKYGKQLEREGEIERALDCYRASVSRFPNSPQLNPIRTRLANIESAHRAKLAREQARKAEIASIKRQLGRSDGYFVIYTREKGKLMYRFEYDVLRGADEAADFVLRLSDKWEWKLTARFPETSDGLAQATELREKRRKKETVMQVPVFN